METPQEKKTLRRVAHQKERMIIYNVLQFCNEEKKNRVYYSSRKSNCKGIKSSRQKWADDEKHT